MDYQRAFQPAWFSQFSWLHYLPILDSVICNLSRVCHSKIEGSASSWYMIRKLILVWWFRNGKNALSKPRIYINLRAHYATNMCYYIVYTQLGHIDEQLKEWLKSLKEKNRNCHLKINNNNNNNYNNCSNNNSNNNDNNKLYNNNNKSTKTFFKIKNPTRKLIFWRMWIYHPVSSVTRRLTLLTPRP